VPRSARARFGRTIIATNIALAALLAGLCALVVGAPFWSFLDLTRFGGVRPAAWAS